ncbi:WXG100 family type VII secretion target [uncultured Microbacterium sp.]|uniref:WXG100 family type VII secretion target n=1 Tax=uncultured Microbacterium sp. TaxID=191216 RepID=UPI0028D003B8|nr:WXG100 family type VII secretion target [uncultured Microbacterium sp.]
MSPVKSYDPGRIRGVAAAVGEANRSIAEALDALDAEVSTLRAAWSGEASDAYDAAQAQWSARLTEMNRILALASGAAANSAERYARGRSKIEARWA